MRTKNGKCSGSSSYIQLANQARRQHCPESVIICIAKAALFDGQLEDARSVIMLVDGPAGDELVRRYENICLAAQAAARTAAQRKAVAATIEEASARVERNERRRGHRK